MKYDDRFLKGKPVQTIISLNINCFYTCLMYSKIRTLQAARQPPLENNNTSFSSSPKNLTFHKGI